MYYLNQHIIVQSIYRWNYHKLATEGSSSDSLSEMSPEQHTKDLEKYRRANIIFFSAKSKMAVKT